MCLRMAVNHILYKSRYSAMTEDTNTPAGPDTGVNAPQNVPPSWTSRSRKALQRDKQGKAVDGNRVRGQLHFKTYVTPKNGQLQKLKSYHQHNNRA